MKSSFLRSASRSACSACLRSVMSIDDAEACAAAGRRRRTRPGRGSRSRRMLPSGRTMRNSCDERLAAWRSRRARRCDECRAGRRDASRSSDALARRHEALGVDAEERRRSAGDHQSDVGDDVEVVRAHLPGAAARGASRSRSTRRRSSACLLADVGHDADQALRLGRRRRARDTRPRPESQSVDPSGRTIAVVGRRTNPAGRRARGSASARWRSSGCSAATYSSSRPPTRPRPSARSRPNSAIAFLRPGPGLVAMVGLPRAHAARLQRRRGSAPRSRATRGTPACAA